MALNFAHCPPSLACIAVVCLILVDEACAVIGCGTCAGIQRGIGYRVLLLRCHSRVETLGMHCLFLFSAAVEIAHQLCGSRESLSILFAYLSEVLGVSELSSWCQSEGVVQT